VHRARETCSIPSFSASATRHLGDDASDRVAGSECDLPFSDQLLVSYANAEKVV